LGTSLRFAIVCLASTQATEEQLQSVSYKKSVKAIETHLAKQARVKYWSSRKEGGTSNKPSRRLLQSPLDSFQNFDLFEATNERKAFDSDISNGGRRRLQEG
jgi:hypothetical protein